MFLDNSLVKSVEIFNYIFRFSKFVFGNYKYSNYKYRINYIKGE